MKPSLLLLLAIHIFSNESKAFTNKLHLIMCIIAPMPLPRILVHCFKFLQQKVAILVSSFWKLGANALPKQSVVMGMGLTVYKLERIATYQTFVRFLLTIWNWLTIKQHNQKVFHLSAVYLSLLHHISYPLNFPKSNKQLYSTTWLPNLHEHVQNFISFFVHGSNFRHWFRQIVIGWRCLFSLIDWWSWWVDIEWKSKMVAMLPKNN